MGLLGPMLDDNDTDDDDGNDDDNDNDDDPSVDDVFITISISSTLS